MRASAVIVRLPQSVDPVELLVLGWVGYDEERWWPDFKTANPDTAVEFDFGTNDADILAKMGLATRPVSSTSTPVTSSYT
jgi:hypothetical protein